jgi:hypothetical protein
VCVCGNFSCDEVLRNVADFNLMRMQNLSFLGMAFKVMLVVFGMYQKL